MQAPSLDPIRHGAALVARKQWVDERRANGERTVPSTWGEELATNPFLRPDSPDLQKTLGMVAAGISEALITTETGLVIALPGLFFHFQLVRSYERYKAFLAHLETVCAQRFHHDESPSSSDPTKTDSMARKVDEVFAAEPVAAHEVAIAMDI